GNLNIDNLIKSTHGNNPKNRLEWIPFEEFADIQQVTEGGFSTIFTALWVKGRITGYSEVGFDRAGSEKIVLKFLKDSQNINSVFIKELNNIALTQPNSNRYIIQSYGVSQDPNTKNYIFVMPYIEHGSLREYLFKHFDDVKWMDWGKSKGSKVNFLKSLVMGIKWIHQKNIIHRDLHSGNILVHQKNILRGNKLVDQENYSLITDLGLSRPADKDPGTEFLEGSQE
ncbi:12054_t:CDS:2, partial [Acaulospora morrowiae]